jgi:hypothetical protein
MLVFVLLGNYVPIMSGFVNYITIMGGFGKWQC